MEVDPWEADEVDPRETNEDTPRNNRTLYRNSIHMAQLCATCAAQETNERNYESARFWVAMAQIDATIAQAAATAWLAEETGR
jgi:hypothetical protein